MEPKLLNRTIEILEERHGKDFTKKLQAQGGEDFYLQEVIKATMNADYNFCYTVTRPNTITKEEV